VFADEVVLGDEAGETLTSENMIDFLNNLSRQILLYLPLLCSINIKMV